MYGHHSGFNEVGRVTVSDFLREETSKYWNDLLLH